MERRGPAICNDSNIREGKDEMIKASIDLQDLRRRIYVKAKAEPSWRFWGLPGNNRASAGSGGIGGGCTTLFVFNGYRVRRDTPKVAPAG